MNIEKLFDSAGPVQVIGSVENVINGRYPEALRQRVLCAKDYQYGFEIGSVKGADTMGEAIMLNGRCYVKSTGEYRGEHTHNSEKFSTSGMFLIPHETKPAYRLNNPSKQSHTLSTLYQRVFEHLQQAFCLVGCLRLETATVAAINKAPIYGDYLFDHIDEYFTSTGVPIAEQEAFIFAAVTDYNDARLSAVNRQLNTVLYKNPFDSEGALTTHVHTLTLKHAVSATADIDASLALDAWHLFEKDCRVRFDSLDIFPINRVDVV